MITDDVYQRLAEALAPAYELGREIGRGGMGLVFQARDTRLHRDVAIKLLPPDLAVDEELRERFSFEAQLAAGLNHPHIVSIHDVDERDNLVWYVMEMVEGESLRVRVERDGPLNASQTARIIREVAWALAYAHARGIVHRDIKPDNILLDRATDRAMVTDFGIAKMARGERKTRDDDGKVIGSLMYMAPEQASGSQDVDGRADIYALGLTAFFLLTGRAPFENASVLSVAARVATGLTPDWASVQPPLDPPFLTLLQKCTEPDPDHRWDDAEQILDALGPAAMAARPMPASIRRLVRDFLLIPTLAFIVLIVSVISEEPSLGEFIEWMGLILVVNFGVTLRSFSRRGHSWADLRDGLEMELLRQSEELEETGGLRERVTTVIYYATTLGLALGAIDLAVVLEQSVLLFALLSFPVAMAAAWLQVRILMFLGGLGRKLIPSLPRPESDAWLSRFADAVLSRLFRPIRHLGPADDDYTATTTGWRHPDLGHARKSKQDIDDLFAGIPRDLRNDVRPARRVARDLTALIERLRRERAEVDRSRELEIESLTGHARQAGVVLERLRTAITDYASGDIDRGRFLAALRHGETLAHGEEITATDAEAKDRKRWLGMQLDAAVSGKASIDDTPVGIQELGRDVLEGLRRRRTEGRPLPGADDINSFVSGVRMLEAEVMLANQRGANIDPLAAESLTESEVVLEQLITAIGEENHHTEELEGLISDVRRVRERIEAILDSRG